MAQQTRHLAADLRIFLDHMCSIDLTEVCCVIWSIISIPSRRAIRLDFELTNIHLIVQFQTIYWSVVNNWEFCRKLSMLKRDHTVSWVNIAETGQSPCWDIHHIEAVPDSKVHGANMGPTWVLSAQDGLHVGPMNLAIRGRSAFTCPGASSVGICAGAYRL